MSYFLFLIFSLSRQCDGFEGWLCSVTLSKIRKPHFAHLVNGVIIATLPILIIHLPGSWQALSTPQLLLPSLVKTTVKREVAD